MSTCTRVALCCLCGASLFGIACSGPGVPEGEPIGRVENAVSAPLSAAYCTLQVDGLGPKETEEDYLPHVIQCENGGANLEALKAQAVAARSVAYYNMATSGSICDAQACQVYSCDATPSAVHYQAVKETSGQYLSYAKMLTYGFYVAGDNSVAPPSCVGAAGTTEHWVTYNESKTGADVEQTELGYVGPPGFGQNRGCMSQYGARCLENSNGYNYLGILRFFYGADIGILTAAGPCITPLEPTLDAEFVAKGSDADPATGDEHDYSVCAGHVFHFWFELQNTGTAAWLDMGSHASATGQAVRLGVPDDATDPLVGADRISLNNNLNNDVRADGPDCSDAPTCRRTRFAQGAGIEATAPATLGLVTTSWRLVDEGNAWFGPELALTFRVVDCGAGTGGVGADGASTGTWPAVDAGCAGGAPAQQLPFDDDKPDGCACTSARHHAPAARTWWLFSLLLAWGWQRRRVVTSQPAHNPNTSRRGNEQRVGQGPHASAGRYRRQGSGRANPGGAGGEKGQ